MNKLQVELSDQHISVLDGLTSYLNESRDRLIAQAIAIMQLVYRGVLIFDYNSFSDGVSGASNR